MFCCMKKTYILYIKIKKKDNNIEIPLLYFNNHKKKNVTATVLVL
jgi:hypothetical protein